jgi:HPt (histidine-containing phosphotransfer) domain-containing protein
MTAYRILHVDDEPDIREIVDMSLGLNAEFEVRACACGADAIAMAAEWSPFLMTLAFSVRSHLQAIRLESLRAVFVQRIKGDAARLAACRSSLGQNADPATVGQIKKIAHGLAGAAGLFGFHQISSDAAAVEDAVIAGNGGEGDPSELTRALDRLMSRMEGQREAPRMEAPRLGAQSAA